MMHRTARNSVLWGFGIAVLLLSPGCGEAPAAATTKRASTVDRTFIRFGKTGEAALSLVRSFPGVKVIENERFVVATDVDDDTARAVLARAEIADFALDRLLGTEPPPGKRAIVWLTDEARETEILRTCGHDFDAATAAASAAFHGAACGIVHLSSRIDPFEKETIRAVVAHECVHQRIAMEGMSSPEGSGAWISEGLPSLFESLASDGSRFDVRDSLRGAQMRGMARGSVMPRLGRLIDGDASQFRSGRTMSIIFDFRGLARMESVPTPYVEAFAATAFLEHVLGEKWSVFVRDAYRGGADRGLLARFAVPVDESLERRFQEFCEK